MTDGFLADTSVFIAAEQGRLPGEPPSGEARISVATLTELLVGVHRSDSTALRELREATLARSRSFVALPYDEPVAAVLGDLLAKARSSGRRRARWTRSSPPRR